MWPHSVREVESSLSPLQIYIYMCAHGSDTQSTCNAKYTTRPNAVGVNQWTQHDMCVAGQRFSTIRYNFNAFCGWLTACHALQMVNVWHSLTSTNCAFYIYMLCHTNMWHAGISLTFIQCWAGCVRLDLHACVRPGTYMIYRAIRELKENGIHFFFFLQWKFSEATQG